MKIYSRSFLSSLILPLAQPSLMSSAALRIVAWVLLASGVVACTTVKETGRMQLMMSDSATEAREGNLRFQQLKAQRTVSSDGSAKSRVTRVGRQLAAVVPARKNTTWEFVVFQDSDPNAFALPGGKIGVNSGLLTLATNDAQLASVLGHEMTHVTARHAAEEKSQHTTSTVGGVLLDIAIAATGAPSIIGDAYGAGMELGVLLPYSRVQEYEADHVGMLYMARAGYDPREAVVFWQRMKAWTDRQGSSSGPSFLKTHPLDAARIQKLQKLLPKALVEYESARQNGSQSRLATNAH